MSDLPNISICLVTYERTDEAIRTVQSTCENLGYPKELRSWYVADDGSRIKHIGSILSELQMNGEKLMSYHSERLRHPGQEETHNAGLGWNKGLGICHQNSDFVLFLEDDWHLDEPLDLVPYVRLLQENEDVGICNFRILAVGADVRTVGYDGRMYLRYLRTTQYAFSGNPYLRHARFTNHYGWFAEDHNPGDMEIRQDDMYRYSDRERQIFRDENDGPQIWRPADISVWGSWKHTGTEKSWK